MSRFYPQYRVGFSGVPKFAGIGDRFVATMTGTGYWAGNSDVVILSVSDMRDFMREQIINSTGFNIKSLSFENIGNAAFSWTVVIDDEYSGADANLQTALEQVSAVFYPFFNQMTMTLWKEQSISGLPTAPTVKVPVRSTGTGSIPPPTPQTKGLLNKIAEDLKAPVFAVILGGLVILLAIGQRK